MANYSNLKAAIAAAIKTNGNQEITGQVLQDVLTSMVSVIGANYTFAGVATPSTNPGTPDQNVVYFASEGGVYTNFNNITVPDGISLLFWNGTWTLESFFVADTTPTAGSNHLIQSNGVYDFGLATDSVDISYLLGNWMGPEDMSYATVTVDATGHNGTFNLYKKSDGNTRIYMDLSGLTNDVFYKVKFDFVTSNGLALSTIGKGSRPNGSWINLYNIYGQKVPTENGTIEFIFKKESTFSYMIIAYNAANLTFPMTATISNFSMKKCFLVKDIDKVTDNTPVFQSNNFIRSHNVYESNQRIHINEMILGLVQKDISDKVFGWQTNDSTVWSITDVSGKNASLTNISSIAWKYVGLDVSNIPVGTLVNLHMVIGGVVRNKNRGPIEFGYFASLAYQSWNGLKNFDGSRALVQSNGAFDCVFRKENGKDWIVIPSNSYNSGTVITVSNFQCREVYDIGDVPLLPSTSSIIPPNYTYENYMSINSVNQGSCVFGNYFFGASAADSQGNLIIKMYDLESKTLVDTLTLTGVATNTHANTLSFGRKYSDGDLFPCLYIPTGYANNGASDVYVCRITGTVGSLSISTVQTIHLTGNDWTEWICGDDNIAWVKTGDNTDTRFRAYTIPALNQSEVTIDSTTQTITDFQLPPQKLGFNISKSDNQDFMYNKGRIWFVSGVPSRDTKNSTFIGVVNVRSQCLETVVWLDDVGLTDGDSNNYEPEGIFIWNNHLYVAFKSFIAKIIKVDLV